MSDSLQSHGLQHIGLPCPSPTPRACSNSCLSSQWCHPTISSLSSPSPAFNVSQHQGLSNESVLPIRWPKYWSFSFSICPSSEYSGLISFRTDWLVVQGTLKSLLQHHSPKSINSSSLIFLYGPTLTSIHDYCKKHSFYSRWTFVGKVMPLLYNMLCKFLVAFLPRSKYLLI